MWKETRIVREESASPNCTSRLSVATSKGHTASMLLLRPFRVDAINDLISSGPPDLIQIDEQVTYHLTKSV